MRYILLFLLSTLLFTQPGVEWSQTFGGNPPDYGRSVEQTSDGGYIITGTTESFGNGNADVWLIKTDSNGNEEWNETFGGSSYDYGHSVEQTSDGGYIITGNTYSFGGGSSNVWLIKTDSNGNEEWNETFGSSYDFGHSVEQTSDGGYIITGYTGPGYGVYDVWLIKTDAYGQEEWNQTFGGSNSNGDVGRSVKQTSDGGYIITGYTYAYGNNDDVWLIKTDANGREEWNETFGGSDWDIGHSVEQTSDGGYIITGETYSINNSDVWLIKTDANGQEEWNETFGGSENDYGYSVLQTSDSGYIIAGHTNSFGNDGPDAWLIKTDSEGTEEWNETFGGTGSDYGYSVKQTSDGGYIIAGDTYSFANGLNDVWLIKIEPDIGIWGCTDEYACNYNPDATADNGSCEYPAEGFNCDGDMIDCAGEPLVLIMEDMQFVQISQSDNCGQFTLFQQAYTSFVNSDIVIDDFITFLITFDGGYNNGYGLPIENIIDFGNFIKIQILQDSSDSISNCEEESYSTVINQANITLYQNLNGIDLCGVCDGDNTECQDCTGVINGDFFIDNCEECVLPGQECIQDCNGDWGGDAVVDECEICGGDNTECADCEGTANGSAYYDECNVCDDSPSNDCVQDCNGDWGGSALIDDCGFCSGGNTGLEYNEYFGCDGECFSGAELDECGVCEGNGAIYECGCTEPEENYDCDGNCVIDIDECGICGGSGPSPSYDCDGNFTLDFDNFFIPCSDPDFSDVFEYEDCEGNCFNNGSCNGVDGCIIGFDTWISNEDCDNGANGLNFLCDEYGWDCNDCGYNIDPLGICAFVNMDIELWEIYPHCSDELNEDGFPESFQFIDCDDMCFNAAEMPGQGTYLDLIGNGECDLDWGINFQCEEWGFECGDCGIDNDPCDICNGNNICDEEEEEIPGDLNGDGTLNVVDIVALVNIIMSGAEYTEEADLNADGSVNIVDIVLMVNWILSPVLE